MKKPAKVLLYFGLDEQAGGLDSILHEAAQDFEVY
jgi:hypothetical protein